MYELCYLRQSEEYGVCFDERAVEVHFFSIKKQSFFDGKTERAKAWRALFHNLKDSPWLGLLRRCRNAAFQSSVRDQFCYLRVPSASPFGGMPDIRSPDRLIRRYALVKLNGLPFQDTMFFHKTQAKFFVRFLCTTSVFLHLPIDNPEFFATMKAAANPQAAPYNLRELPETERTFIYDTSGRR